MKKSAAWMKWVRETRAWIAAAEANMAVNRMTAKHARLEAAAHLKEAEAGDRLVRVQAMGIAKARRDLRRGS